MGQRESASASTSGTATFTYIRFAYPFNDSLLVGADNATALATPGQSTILGINTSIRSPSSSSAAPGQTLGAAEPSQEILATAGWIGVEARVSGQNGQTPPSAIRLEFQLNYQPPSVIDKYGLVAGSNEPSSFQAQNLSVAANGYVSLAGAGSYMQEGEAAVKALPDGSLLGTFHIDLGLSATGISKDLFSISMSLFLDTFSVMQNWTGAPNGKMSLSMAGIYVPDGTPISNSGYDVTLGSGMDRASDPAPDPEPGTMIIWSLLAGFGAVSLRRCRTA